MWFAPNGLLSVSLAKYACRGSKSRFLKLNAEHIQYVLDCLKDNPPRIRNIKQYLLAALYNAPLTIENYYAAQIDYDLCGGKR